MQKAAINSPVKAIISSAVLFLAFTASAADLIDEIGWAETRLRPNPRDGDHGKALGPYQMHKGAWEDGCRRLGVTWPHRMARDPKASRLVARAHLLGIQADFTRLSGRAPSPADSYALWNIGLSGYQKLGWQFDRVPGVTRRAVAAMNTMALRHPTYGYVPRPNASIKANRPGTGGGSFSRKSQGGGGSSFRNGSTPTPRHNACSAGNSGRVPKGVVRGVRNVSQAGGQ